MVSVRVVERGRFRRAVFLLGVLGALGSGCSPLGETERSALHERVVLDLVAEFPVAGLQREIPLIDFGDETAGDLLGDGSIRPIYSGKPAQ